jgi:DNA sulfur modification protein DndD
MNRSGKTSLLMALYLCLFGREAMFHLEGIDVGGTEEEQIKSYRQLLERILHRPSINEYSDPTAIVQVKFANSEEAVGITHTWFYRRGGSLRDLRSSDAEEVRVEHNGRPRSYVIWQEANNRVADLLFPPHVMPCFFFDGEQAQKRVEASGRGALTEAIRALFGTGLVEALDESLRTYVNNKRLSLRRDVGDVRAGELEHKRQRRDEIESELRQIAANLQSAQTELENLESARRQKQNELTQLVGDASIDLKLLSDRKVEAEKEEQSLQEKFQSTLAQLALPIAMRRLGRLAREQLNAEIVRDRWLIVKEETSKKAEAILAKALPSAGDSALQPPLTEEQRQELSTRLREALATLWDPPPYGCATDFRHRFLAAADRVSTISRLEQLERTAIADIGAIANRWQAQIMRVRDIRRQWDTLQVLGPRLKELKDQLSELDEQVRAAFARKQSLENRKHGLESELKDLRATIGQMENLRQKFGPLEQRIDVAQRVREVIADIKDQLVPLCKEALEAHCSEHFREMISPELRQHKVQFDHELQPMLVRGNAAPIYIETLSGAQKRAFGLAFALAVADVSGVAAPIVVDTPVGNMDSEFRKRILLHLAKHSPGQVIFLSHDEEIYGEYAEELEPYVLKKFLVDYEEIGDGFGVSTVFPDRYFG